MLCNVADFATAPVGLKTIEIPEKTFNRVRQGYHENCRTRDIERLTRVHEWGCGGSIGRSAAYIIALGHAERQSTSCLT